MAEAHYILYTTIHYLLLMANISRACTQTVIHGASWVAVAMAMAVAAAAAAVMRL